MTGNDRRGIVLQPRDRHLVGELAIMRVIDREQAKRVAGFGSTTRANYRLLALTRAGILRRFFIGTEGGARKALYALSQNGAKLAEVPYRGPRRRRQDETLVTDFFVTHQMRINELYCTLKHASMPDGAAFVRWLSFQESLEGEALIPDGYVEIATNANTLAAFLEVDLGHESRSVWRRKVRAYLHYAIAGKFQERFKAQQFRTLVVGNSERRVASLRAATAELSDKIFWFTTFDAIERDGFWSPIWQRPKDDRRLPLLPRSQ